MDKISVIIPVYNVEEYLPRCVESILNSTYENLEIICVNDGSTDGSLKVLKNYAKKDKRIVIIDKPNGGVSSSRNEGLKKATGEYISFIDSDDWVHSEFFEILLRGIKVLGADIAICDYAKKYEDQEELQEASHIKTAFTEERINALNPPHMLRSFIWGRIYDRKILTDKFFNENVNYMEDKDLSLSLIAENENLVVAKTEAPLYNYFIRSNSISNSVNIPKTVAALEYILNRADDYDEKRAKVLYINEALRYSLIIYNRAVSQKDTKENKKLAKALVKKCAVKMQSAGAFPLKHRIIYGIFSAFPILHRVIRSAKLLVKPNK